MNSQLNTGRLTKNQTQMSLATSGEPSGMIPKMSTKQKEFPPPFG